MEQAENVQLKECILFLKIETDCDPRSAVTAINFFDGVEFTFFFASTFLLNVHSSFSLPFLPVRPMAPPKTTISQPQDSHVALSNLLASSTAALASRLCTHPLDTVKTRIQVSNSPHQGLIPTFVELVRTRAVYRGLPIALALSVPGLSVYLTTYDLAKDRLSRQFDGFGTDTVQNHMMSGMIAEVFSGLFWTPMEILKSKQQVENMSSGMYSSTAATGATGKSASSPTASNVSPSTLPSASSSTTSMIPKYTSTANLARQIYQHEGFLGFYRGYFITLGVFV